MRRIACLLVSLVVINPVPLLACFNDEDTEPYEVQQQETYEYQEPESNLTLQIAEAASFLLPKLAAVAIGSVSLIAAGVVVIANRRPKA